MKKPFIEISGEISISPFDAIPLTGYEAPKGFPNCCDRHKTAFEEAQKWFKAFPNCCDPHRALAQKYWFDTWLKHNDFSGIAEKLIKEISYTEHVISEKIDTEDWHKSICDYIDYCVLSFGQPAIGLHIYLGNLRHYIEQLPKMPEPKRGDLLDFLGHYYNPPRDSKQKIDFNLLYKTYQDWVNAFPFELNSYFGSIKQQYRNQLPIIDGTPEVNIYTGISKIRVIRKERLFKVLIDLTNNLLTQVNGLKLYEQGLLTDTNKMKLELVIAERKRKIEQGYKYNSPDETTQYKKMIQYWLRDEMKFIDEITPLLSSTAASPSTGEKKLSINQIALIHAYNGNQITRKNSDHIAKQYGYNSGEKLFQRFTRHNSKANRKGSEATDKKNENKIRLIESVIPHLSEEGKRLATDELQMLKSRHR